MQQSPSAIHSQQGSSDLVSLHGPTFRNQMGPGMMHSQPSNVHPVGQKMGHEDNLSGRGGNEYYYNSSKEIPVMGPSQPNIAPIPMPRNQQVPSFICAYGLNHHCTFHFNEHDISFSYVNYKSSDCWE